MRRLGVLLCLFMLFAVSASGCFFFPEDDGEDVFVISFNQARAYKDEQTLITFGPRLTGTQSEHQAAGYIRDQFEDFGLKNVDIEWYNMTAYEVKDADISVVTYDNVGRVSSRETYDHITDFVVQGYSGSRDHQDSFDDIEMIDVGDGTDDELYNDADGKAVLVTTEAVQNQSMTLTDLFVKAWEHGAAANIIQNVHIHAELDDAPYQPISFTASVKDGKHWKPLPDDYSGDGPDIPSCMVSKSVGDLIRGHIDNQIYNPVTGESNRKMQIDFDVVVEERPVAVVVGEVWGSGDSLVMIGAHHDSVYNGDGAVDNTCGVATILEMARNMAGKRPKNTIRFATFGGEEQAIFGSRLYIDAHPGLLDNLTLYINMDMVNVNLAKGNRVTIGSTDDRFNDGVHKVVSAVKDKHSWAKKYDVHYYTDDLDRGSDQANFAVKGADAMVYWGSGSVGYHTHYDTIEHISAESLTFCGMVLGSYALRV